MLPRRPKHSHVFLWHWILSVVYLQPWLIRNRQCGAAPPTYPTLILILLVFFLSFCSRNFILPLSHHWSVSSHWSPSFEPGLVSLAACCLNTPGAAGGPTMNQSPWGTSELTAVTSSQGLFSPSLYSIVIFICLSWSLTVWKFCITLLASLLLLAWSWKHRQRLASTFQGGRKKPL